MEGGDGRDRPGWTCGRGWGPHRDGEADSCINGTRRPWAALGSHLQRGQELGFQTVFSRGRVWAFF